MAATPSVLIRKSFSYRGAPRLWTNRYHFVGGVPSNDAAWSTFIDNIVTAEKLALIAANTFVDAAGYAAGSDIPVYTKTLSGTGSFAAGSNQVAPGDCAAMLRFTTDAKTSRNHPVYLYSWYHSALFAAGAPDVVVASWVTALNTYGTAWINGFSDGTNTLHRAGPNGAVALTRATSTVMRHRDFRH